MHVDRLQIFRSYRRQVIDFRKVMSVEIRPATEADLPQILEIFQHYVLNTVVSFLVQKPNPDYIKSRWLDTKQRGLPYLVAVDTHSQRIVGYASASAFRGYMLGYGHSVEISLFCAPGHTSRGIGGKLLRALLQALRETKHVSNEVGYEDNKVEFEIKKVFAVMAVDETAPAGGLALRDWYVKFGFEQIGRLKGVGSKKGRR